MRVHLICRTHNTTALVGPGSLLGEYECVTCIAKQDAANEWRPCCPYMNTTCCGHDDWQPEIFTVTVIDSPNYCDIDHEMADVPF